MACQLFPRHPAPVRSFRTLQRGACSNKMSDPQEPLNSFEPLRGRFGSSTAVVRRSRWLGRSQLSRPVPGKEIKDTSIPLPSKSCAQGLRVIQQLHALAVLMLAPMPIPACTCGKEGTVKKARGPPSCVACSGTSTQHHQPTAVLRRSCTYLLAKSVRSARMRCLPLTGRFEMLPGMDSRDAGMCPGLVMLRVAPEHVILANSKKLPGNPWAREEQLHTYMHAYMQPFVPSRLRAYIRYIGLHTYIHACICSCTNSDVYIYIYIPTYLYTYLFLVVG